MDPDLVTAAIAEAEEGGMPIAEVPLARIARRAGVSRSTLFRRIHDRDALEAAVREAGVDPGHRPTVRERAIDAAVELIVRGGVGTLTVEEVARRAGCAIASLYSQFDGRDGLLVAVLERHAPLPAVERVLRDRPAGFEDTVRLVYTTFFDALTADLGAVEALLAEALARPDGPVMDLAGRLLLPRITTTVGRWLGGAIETGQCRDVQISMLLPLFVAPLGAHVVARKRLLAAGAPVPERETVIETMTAAFCRAVAP